MSLSNNHEKFQGRVFLGVDTPGPNETTVQEIEGKKRLIWDEAVNEEYLSRVRTKAQDKAKEILAQAMREAEVLRSQAEAKGFDQGIRKAQAKVEAHLEAGSNSLARALTALAGQGREVWKAREADLVNLIRLAVEKTLALELSERRIESLNALLTDALERIESQRRLVIHVAPQDAEAITEMVERARDKHPDIKHFRVMTDPGVDHGLIIEAEDAKVNNTMPVRWAGVAEIMDQLGVPLDAPKSGPPSDSPDTSPED